MSSTPRKPVRPIHLQRVDLNLIRLFNAIYQERQVTRAGALLHMSQSAVSHGLRSLRLIFDDPLFVRTPDGMTPTALADRLAEQVQTPLEVIQQAFSRRNDFDPGQSEIDFTVGLTTNLHPQFVAELCRGVRLAAPNVRVIIQALMVDEVLEALDTRNLDIVVGDIAPIRDMRRFKCHQLIEDKVVCVVAQSNAEVGEVLDLELYARLPHLVVAADKFGRTWIDDRLAELGLKRKIAAIVPSVLYVEQVVPDSPFICTVMSSLIARSPRLRFMEPPFPGRAHEFGLIWHARDDDHAPVVWLREMLKDVWARCRAANVGAALT